MSIPLKSLPQAQSLQFVELLQKSNSDETTKTLDLIFVDLMESNCHMDIIKLLILDIRVDICIKDNYAIKWSSSKGH